MKRVIILVLTAAILILSLIAVAAIPTEKISENLETSAEYVSWDKKNWRYVLDGVDASQLDLYADSMLLNIAYYMDSDHPLQSVMWARYFREDGIRTSESFLKAVTENPEPNKEYVRYWHGSLMFVRPLLLIMDIQGIYVFHAIILSLLFLYLLFLLIRRNLKAEAISLCIALLAVNAVFVPFCLEYYWMFLLMFIASILSVWFSLGGLYDSLTSVFLIIGIVAAFLDFFTTETLTITVPLLLSLRIRERQGRDEGGLKLVIKCMLLWGIGYAGMWMLKWIIASVVTGENAMQYVQGSIGEHLLPFTA